MVTMAVNLRNKHQIRGKVHNMKMLKIPSEQLQLMTTRFFHCFFSVLLILVSQLIKITLYKKAFGN